MRKPAFLGSLKEGMSAALILCSLADPFADIAVPSRPCDSLFDKLLRSAGARTRSRSSLSSRPATAGAPSRISLIKCLA